MISEIIIKKLDGFSGSRVFLMKNKDRLFIRKIGNVERNYEQLPVLSKLDINCPAVLSKNGDVLDMEYIHGLDMITYLKHNSEKPLIDFLMKSLDTLSKGSQSKNYFDDYVSKITNVDFKHFKFTKIQLLDSLPACTQQSNYHGDMTLENIIFSEGKFFFIDPVSIEYDSFIFDIAKLRQDLECKWFLRKSKARLDTKLYNIQNALLDNYPEARCDSFLILMLLRVFNHSIEDSFEQRFLISEINKLWK